MAFSEARPSGSHRGSCHCSLRMYVCVHEYMYLLTQYSLTDLMVLHFIPHILFFQFVFVVNYWYWYFCFFCLWIFSYTSLVYIVLPPLFCYSFAFNYWFLSHHHWLLLHKLYLCAVYVSQIKSPNTGPVYPPNRQNKQQIKRLTVLSIRICMNPLKDEYESESLVSLSATQPKNWRFLCTVWSAKSPRLFGPITERMSGFGCWIIKAVFRELGETTDTILMLSNPPNKRRDISGEDECGRYRKGWPCR